MVDLVVWSLLYKTRGKEFLFKYKKCFQHFFAGKASSDVAESARRRESDAQTQTVLKNTNLAFLPP